MIENLVIVESPAKAKTIEKFLGNGYTVKSSFGHIRDLEKKDLGVDIEHNFQPKYEISSDKKTIVKELKTLAKEAKTVWLASDEDREYFMRLPKMRFSMRFKTQETLTKIWWMPNRPGGYWTVWSDSKCRRCYGKR